MPRFRPAPRRIAALVVGLLGLALAGPAAGNALPIDGQASLAASDELGAFLFSPRMRRARAESRGDVEAQSAARVYRYEALLRWLARYGDVATHHLPPN